MLHRHGQMRRIKALLDGQTSGGNGLGGTTGCEDTDVQGDELLGKVNKASLVIDGEDSYNGIFSHEIEVRLGSSCLLVE